MSSTAILVQTPEAEVELAGSREFVEKHLEILRLFGIVPGAREPAEAAELPPDAGPRTVDAFLKSIGVSPQTTMVQDLIVIFGYYVTHVQRRASFTVEDLEFHFAHAGIRPPKNLANALGALKRKRNCIDKGEKRGSYNLTQSGVRFVMAMIKE